MKRKLLLTAILAVSLPVTAADAPDLQMHSRIREEGFRNSKVMEIASGLTDLIGARITGSPNMKRANEWTRDKMTELGLSNAHLESWGPFGRGWSYDSCEVRMTSPEALQLYAIPGAWSPSTDGVVRGRVVRAKLQTKEDLEKQKGKLGGAIVMIADPRDMKPRDAAALDRYDEEELAKIGAYGVPAARDRSRWDEYRKRREFRRLLAQFAAEEKIALIIDSGAGDNGSFRIQTSGSWRTEEPVGVPTVTLAPEHYARIARLVETKTPVEIEADVRTKFHTDDLNAYNTLAEIPGSDKRGEVVILGAHLDSWHGGTGATDNAAGCAVMMEAARIIKAIGVQPKRTIRVALWAAEEQGLLGSRAYVEKHLAAWPEPKDPAERDVPPALRRDRGVLILKPEYSKLAAYFNVDNGTGKIRGIYTQENAAVRPIFEKWIEPLRDLGVTTVTMRNTGGTDHTRFDEVGLPGFQFIQDPVEYEALTHHTNWDTYERLQREDLMQAAVVVATFAWEAANRAEMLPRKNVK